MTCVNCQCNQENCVRFCDYRHLHSLCDGCRTNVVVVPNADLRMGTPMARTSTGEYTVFNPTATPPQRFVGFLYTDWQTDSDGIGNHNTPWLPGIGGYREVPIWISGLFRITDLDITTAQLNAIVTQGRGTILGDPNSLSGLVKLY